MKFRPAFALRPTNQWDAMRFGRCFALHPTASLVPQHAFRKCSGEIVGKWRLASGVIVACLLWASMPVGRNAIRALFCTASHGIVGRNEIQARFCTASHEPVGRNAEWALFCIASHGTVGCNVIRACFCVASHGFAGITACVQGMFRRDRWKTGVCEWPLRARLLWSGMRVGRNAIQACFCIASHEPVGRNEMLACLCTASHESPRISGTQCDSGMFLRCVPWLRRYHSLRSGDVQAGSLENRGLRMASSCAPAVGRHASGTQCNSGAVLHSIPRNSGTQCNSGLFLHCIPRTSGTQ